MRWNFAVENVEIKWILSFSSATHTHTQTQSQRETVRSRQKQCIPVCVCMSNVVVVLFIFILFSEILFAKSNEFIVYMLFKRHSQFIGDIAEHDVIESLRVEWKQTSSSTKERAKKQQLK